MSVKFRSILSIAIVLATGVIAEEVVEVSRATPLFLKPIFELTEKDQVLLDILHHDKVVASREDFSYLEEKGNRYPAAFEKAYERYVDTMGNLRPTRRRYLNAINNAANYLLSLLFPDTYSEKPETTSNTEVDTATFSGGDLATLLIGIDYEGTGHELQNCIHDIEHVMNQLLMPQLKAKKEHMIFMSDHKFGTDFYPTAKNIRGQFDKFVKNVQKTKQGYFHYSGHGSYIRDYSGDEKDRRDEVLVPVDSDYNGYIKDDEIFQTLVKGLPSDAKLTVTSDCCHSGTVLDLPFKWMANGSHTVEVKLSDEELASLPDVVLLSGCKDTQTAADGGFIPGETRGAGAMTAAYLQTLKKHNYVLTYRELLSGVHEILERGGFEQKPQLSSTRALDLDEHFLSRQVSLRP